MIIKYLVSHLIFKIINFLPAGKICNYLNYYLVVYLGSNHKRRLWNLKKTILKGEHACRYALLHLVVKFTCDYSTYI